MVVNGGRSVEHLVTVLVGNQRSWGIGSLHQLAVILWNCIYFRRASAQLKSSGRKKKIGYQEEIIGVSMVCASKQKLNDCELIDKHNPT